jgi:hypothetical protein
MSILASVSEVDRALESVQAMLGEDGYGLRASLESGTLALDVQASPDACRDCLVGKDLLILIVLDALRDAGIQADASDVEATYPNDS